MRLQKNKAIFRNKKSTKSCCKNTKCKTIKKQLKSNLSDNKKVQNVFVKNIKNKTIKKTTFSKNNNYRAIFQNNKEVQKVCFQKTTNAKQ